MAARAAADTPVACAARRGGPRSCAGAGRTARGPSATTARSHSLSFTTDARPRVRSAAQVAAARNLVASRELLQTTYQYNTFTIQLQANNNCLDSGGFGGQTHVEGCNGGAYQQWQAKPNGPAGYYNLINVATGTQSERESALAAEGGGGGGGAGGRGGRRRPLTFHGPSAFRRLLPGRPVREH